MTEWQNGTMAPKHNLILFKEEVGQLIERVLLVAVNSNSFFRFLGLGLQQNSALLTIFTNPLSEEEDVVVDDDDHNNNDYDYDYITL